MHRISIRWLHDLLQFVGRASQRNLLTKKPKPPRHTKDMGIDGQNLAAHTEHQDTIRRLRADTGKLAQRAAYIGCRPVAQILERNLALLFFDLMQGLENARSFLISKSSPLDFRGDLPGRHRGNVLPITAFSEPVKRLRTGLAGRLLGKNGLDQMIDEAAATLTGEAGKPVFRLQPPEDLFCQFFSRHGRSLPHELIRSFPRWISFHARIA